MAARLTLSAPHKEKYQMRSLTLRLAALGATVGVALMSGCAATTNAAQSAGSLPTLGVPSSGYPRASSRG